MNMKRPKTHVLTVARSTKRTRKTREKEKRPLTGERISLTEAYTQTNEWKLLNGAGGPEIWYGICGHSQYGIRISVTHSTIQVNWVQKNPSNIPLFGWNSKRNIEEIGIVESPALILFISKWIKMKDWLTYDHLVINSISKLRIENSNVSQGAWGSMKT